MLLSIPYTKTTKIQQNHSIIPCFAVNSLCHQLELIASSLKGGNEVFHVNCLQLTV